MAQDRNVEIRYSNGSSSQLPVSRAPYRGGWIRPAALSLSPNEPVPASVETARFSSPGDDELNIGLTFTVGRPARRFDDVFDIYSSAQAVSPYLSQALMLLRDISIKLRSAADYSDAGERLEADDLVQRVKVTSLPELFLLSGSLGDGFALATLSLHTAIENLRGQPIAAAQIRALESVAQKLHREPFLSPAAALRVDEILEDVGLRVDAPEMDALLDVLSVVAAGEDFPHAE